MTPSLLGFEPCRNAEYGCDNYLIAQVSQDDGVCRQCAAQWQQEHDRHARLYQATKSLTMGLSEAPSAPTGHSGQPCPTCQHPDGSINEAWAKEEGACCLCGSSVIPWGEGGAGFCSRCKDHSANSLECEACGRSWSDWSEGQWEVEK